VEGSVSYDYFHRGMEAVAVKTATILITVECKCWAAKIIKVDVTGSAFGGWINEGSSVPGDICNGRVADSTIGLLVRGLRLVLRPAQMYKKSESNQHNGCKRGLQLVSEGRSAHIPHMSAL
jgi:hypothetical protein